MSWGQVAAIVAAVVATVLAWDMAMTNNSTSWRVVTALCFSLLLLLVIHREEKEGTEHEE